MLQQPAGTGFRMPWEYFEEGAPDPGDAVLRALRRDLERQVAPAGWARLAQVALVATGVTAAGAAAALPLTQASRALCLYVAVASAGGYAALCVERQAATSAAAALSRPADSRLLGTVAEYCHHSDPMVASAALAALRRMLQAAGPAEAACMTADQVHALLWMLASPDPSLVVAILCAVERMADPRAIWEVRRLLGGRPWQERSWSDTDRAMVRLCGERCLVALKEAQRLQYEPPPAPDLLRPRARPGSPSALLRPAEPAAPAHLLRPATPAPDAPPELLQRSSDGGTPGDA